MSESGYSLLKASTIFGIAPVSEEAANTVNALGSESEDPPQETSAAIPRNARTRLRFGLRTA
jgi:hypothetical protein